MQDWYAQLCAKSYADPKSSGHLQTFNLQESYVSFFKILPRVPRLHRNSKGDDYALFLGDKSFNLHKDNESPTSDRCLSIKYCGTLPFYSVEAQLDYWREDPFLHAFHCILHHAWSQFSCFSFNHIWPQLNLPRQASTGSYWRRRIPAKIWNVLVFPCSVPEEVGTLDSRCAMKVQVWNWAEPSEGSSCDSPWSWSI